MSTIISVIILILSMLITAFLQLTPGLFAIFYHYALGKHSAKKADDLGLSFILGTEIFVTIFWAIIYLFMFIIFQNSPDFPTPIFLWIMFGIFIAEATITLFFYYKKGKEKTALFIPRHVASTLITRAQKSTTRSDALVLGFCANLSELFLTLPLYIISATVLLNTTILPRALFIILYIITVTMPLFITRSAYRTGHNLAGIERFRVHSKLFFRIIICVCYLLIAIAILNLGII